MNDARLAAFVTRMMREDIAPTLTVPRGLALNDYIESILRLFHNPAIRHLLAQIAWDGSQKLPFRLFGTIADRLQHGAHVERLAVPIAAWMHFIRRKALHGVPVTDPLAHELFAIGINTRGVADDVDAFLAFERMFPRTLVTQSVFAQAVKTAYARLVDVSSPAALAAALPA